MSDKKKIIKAVETAGKDETVVVMVHPDYEHENGDDYTVDVPAHMVDELKTRGFRVAKAETIAAREAAGFDAEEFKPKKAATAEPAKATEPTKPATPTK